MEFNVNDYAYYILHDNWISDIYLNSRNINITLR